MASNVTFTKADDGTVRVRTDKHVFPLGKEITNVADATVKELQALPGLTFKVDDPKPAGDAGKK